MKKLIEEAGRTVRDAMQDWSRTVRLVCLLAAATAAGTWWMHVLR